MGQFMAEVRRIDLEREDTILRLQRGLRTELLGVLNERGAEAAFESALEWSDGGADSLRDRLKILSGVRALPGLAMAAGDEDLLIVAHERLLEMLQDQARAPALRHEALSALLGVRKHTEFRYWRSLRTNNYFRPIAFEHLRADLEPTVPPSLIEGENVLMRPGIYHARRPGERDMELFQELAASAIGEDRELAQTASVALLYLNEAIGLASLQDRLGEISRGKGTFKDVDPEQAYSYAATLTSAILKSVSTEGAAASLLEIAAVSDPNPRLRGVIIDRMQWVGFDAADRPRVLALAEANVEYVAAVGADDPAGAAFLADRLADAIGWTQVRSPLFSDEVDLGSYIDFVEKGEAIYQRIMTSFLMLPPDPRLDEPGNDMYDTWNSHVEYLAQDFGPMQITVGNDLREIPLGGMEQHDVLRIVLERHAHLPRARRLLDLFTRVEREARERARLDAIESGSGPHE